MADYKLELSQKEQLMTFFEQEAKGIVNQWLETTKISVKDPFYNDILHNAQNTVRLLNIYFRRPNKQLVRDLTKKIVSERIEANSDLGQLIHNINLGRQIILDRMTIGDFSIGTLKGGMLIINNFFDSYLYYAVVHYTEMKDRIISEKTRFIQEMHNDRLSILGQISASFAHEFRNPLTSIKGFISLLEKRMPDDEEAGYYFSIINKEMLSLEKKVSQFLYLSKMKGLGDDMSTFNVTVLVKEMINFMYPRFVVEAIEVNQELEQKLTVKGIPEQIKQVLLNIMNNAVEELSETSGERHIFIKAETTRTKQMICSITNSGRKIPNHILENIFEPFISTKELGTGLGLAVCKQIIEKHEGDIWATSKEGTTTFSFSLPLSK